MSLTRTPGRFEGYCEDVRLDRVSHRGRDVSLPCAGLFRAPLVREALKTTSTHHPWGGNPAADTERSYMTQWMDVGTVQRRPSSLARSGGGHPVAGVGVRRAIGRRLLLPLQRLRSSRSVPDPINLAENIRK